MSTSRNNIINEQDKKAGKIDKEREYITKIIEEMEASNKYYPFMQRAYELYFGQLISGTFYGIGNAIGFYIFQKWLKPIIHKKLGI